MEDMRPRYLQQEERQQEKKRKAKINWRSVKTTQPNKSGGRNEGTKKYRSRGKNDAKNYASKSRQ